MKRFPLVMIMVCFAVLQLNAQFSLSSKKDEAPNFFIITTDGLRWQELFNGMQDDIVNQKKFHRGDSNYLFNKYGGATSEARREKLMPFFWNTIATQGQIYGNRQKNNKVDVANNQWFSYPGYNEILTGYFDTAIQSNDYPPNPNSNLFAYLNKQDPIKIKLLHLLHGMHLIAS